MLTFYLFLRIFSARAGVRMLRVWVRASVSAIVNTSRIKGKRSAELYVRCFLAFNFKKQENHGAFVILNVRAYTSTFYMSFILYKLIAELSDDVSFIRRIRYNVRQYLFSCIYLSSWSYFMLKTRFDEVLLKMQDLIWDLYIYI